MLSIFEVLATQKKGFNALVAVSQAYQGAGETTTRRFIRESPDIVRRYVKSQIQAVTGSRRTARRQKKSW